MTSLLCAGEVEVILQSISAGGLAGPDAPLVSTLLESPCTQCNQLLRIADLQSVAIREESTPTLQSFVRLSWAIGRGRYISPLTRQPPPPYRLQTLMSVRRRGPCCARLALLCRSVCTFSSAECTSRSQGSVLLVSCKLGDQTWQQQTNQPAISHIVSGKLADKRNKACYTSTSDSHWCVSSIVCDAVEGCRSADSVQLRCSWSCFGFCE